MNSIANLIGNNINYFIFILATFEIILLIFLYREFKNSEKELLNFLTNISEKCELKIQTTSIPFLLTKFSDFINSVNNEKYFETKGYFENIDRQREKLELNKAMNWYNIMWVVVEIFPVLGIIGTVSAMISSVPENTKEFTGDSISKMFGGFNTALTSTFYGLLFSILFLFIITWIDTNFKKIIEECKKFEQLMGDVLLKINKSESKPK